MKSPISVRCSIVEGGRVGDGAINGVLTKLSSKRAELRLDKAVPVLADLKIQIIGDAGLEVQEPAYCEVEGALPGSDGLLSVRFTSLPHRFEALLRDPDERVAANPPPTPPTDEGRSTGTAQPAAIGLRDREAARAAISRGAIGAASRTA